MMFATGVEAFTTSNRGAALGTVWLLFLFGPALAVFTYCITFAFESPSKCNFAVVCSNFLSVWRALWWCSFFVC